MRHDGIETAGLLEAATLVRSEDDLAVALERVARVVGEALGFGVVVTNLYRREWDDFVVSTVYGDDEVRSHLLGCTYPRTFFDEVLIDRFDCGGAYVIPAGSYDWDPDAGERFVPDVAAPTDQQAWHPEDEIFVPVHSSERELLAIFCVGMPLHGRRPNAQELETLCAVTHQAAIALEAAQAAVTATRQRRALQHLLRVSGNVTSVSPDAAPMELVAHAIRDALGLLKVVVYTVDGTTLVPSASAGWAPDAAAVRRSFPIDAFDPLMRKTFELKGCYLVPADEARAVAGEHQVYHSEMNGRGPHAWQNHWLLVPLRGREGQLIGVIWADDPADRLLPGRDTLRALRMFANQAATAIETAADVAALREITAMRTHLLEEKERLLARVVEIGEAERARVAADLHDGPIQNLTAVAIGLDLLVMALDRGDIAQARQAAASIRAELSDEIASVRRVMANLRPPILDERGVTPALSDCALDVLGNMAIGVQISSDVEGRLAPELETVVYRITREALINVRKHSQAKQVMVRLKRAGKRLALTIADDGVGFDGATLRDRATHHLGLTRIHELAGSLGGGSRVTSGIGAGTTVDVGLPLLES